MLGALALIPHTTGSYEQLPLLLIPKTGRRFAFMMGLTYLAAFCANFIVDYEGLPRTQRLMVTGMLERQWPYFLVLVYLPALYFVLRPTIPGVLRSALRQGTAPPHPDGS